MDLSSSWKQAQEAVVGAMLLDERCVGEVLQATGPAHFPDPGYRHIYEAVRGLFGERRPIDPVTVLAAAGGEYRDLIASAMERTPTAANVQRYVEILQDSARLSAYQGAAMELLRCETAAAAAQIWDSLGQVRMQGEKTRILRWQDAVGRYLDRMNDPAPPDVLCFGIKQLDGLLSVGRGKFVIMAADSSTGKTALALQFAFHIASSGKRVGFFSLETDSDTLVDRLMSETQVAGIDLPRSKKKALTTEDYEAAVAAGRKSGDVPLFLIDSCETVEEIRTWTIQEGFDVIVVDYLQLVQGAGEKRWDIVTGVSMALHSLAQRLGVTVIGLSQVTPASKGAKLTMDDLRESRQLKHDADVILLLERCDEFPNGRTLTVAKNKDGKKNNGMRLSFDPLHMTFSYFRRTASPPAPELQELPDGEGGDLPF